MASRAGSVALESEVPKVDTMMILQVLFGSVISVTTALAFVEIRRLRKKLSH